MIPGKVEEFEVPNAVIIGGGNVAMDIARSLLVYKNKIRAKSELLFSSFETLGKNFSQTMKKSKSQRRRHNHFGCQRTCAMCY